MKVACVATQNKTDQSRDNLNNIHKCSGCEENGKSRTSADQKVGSLIRSCSSLRPPFPQI